MARQKFDYEFEPFEEVYGTNSAIVPIRSPFQKLSPTGERIAEQVRTEALMEEGMRVKARIGADVVSDVHDYTNARMERLIDRITDREESITNDKKRERMEAFNNHQLKRAGNHLIHVANACAYRVGEIVNNPLQQPPEPPPEPKRGLFRRMLGS